MNEEISLTKIIQKIKKHFILVFTLFLISIGIAIYLSFFVFPKVYQAQTQLLVNQKSNLQEVLALSQIETDLQLIDTYNVIMKSPVIIDKVIEELDTDISSTKLSNKIFVFNEENSKVVNLKIEDEDPEQAVIIANKIAEVFTEEIPKIMSVDNITVLSKAKLSENPTPIKPNKKFIIAIGGVVGLLLGICIAFLLEILDSTIKDEEDLVEIIDLPVIGYISPIKNGVSKNLKIYKVRGT